MAETEERPLKMRKLEPLNDISNSQTDGQGHIDNDLKAPQQTIEKRKTESVISSDSEHEEQEQDASQNRTAGGLAGDSGTPSMSKNQLKKLRRKAVWEAGKDYRKEQKKSKITAKRAQRAEDKAALLASGIDLAALAKPRPTPSTQVPVTLLLDCDFDSYMTVKEVMSLGQQITRCYSDNKHAKYRAHLVVSSFGGRLKERYETVLSNHHLGWKGVTFSEKFFVEAGKDAHDVMIGPKGGRVKGALLDALLPTDNIPVTTAQEPGTSEEIQQPNEPASEPEKQTTAQPPQAANGPGSSIPSEPVLTPQIPDIPIPTAPQIVYLSSDSEHTLNSLSPYTIYVIGGIVDKNRHKGLCHRRANELGIPTAKLPIGEYMQMQSRTVLTTNHVVEIMANWLETGDWGEAFLKAIPKRKEAVLRKGRKKQKLENEKEGEDEGGDDAQEEDTIEMDETNNDEAAPEISEGQNAGAADETV
ncbi:tRNA (guanine(9)-N(1))-methyltransferase [Pseudogymnoascus destructans]|uniref:tRNA (guanine(9)-N1)-methyltransferase n=2 Tax=Pseudogymnoascus destructans TaxID=655981 RepID=L8GCW1_PSED2|nr:tRNA (guanine(9)-N(1))-methyltransferase [Pseudogymnoascus destructans]ELR09916.1 hypothetical protein GMDG_04392 [Pseudogymnoascus destructans 20631-21]OAF56575.1 tRNA (guanine(9)-N(1))-methyltransferase [Pseudogymnoascus destructans]